MKKIIIALLVFISIQQQLSAKEFTVTSPDQKIGATIIVDKDISYSLSYKGSLYLLPSAISITLNNGVVLGQDVKFIKEQRKSVHQTILPLFSITKEIKEQYNELVLQFSGSYSISFRVYNEGFAYRFETSFQEPVTVVSEKSTYRFNGNYTGYFHPALSESDYHLLKFSELAKNSYSSLPLLVKTTDHVNLLIHESDVSDYPCMSITNDPANPTALLGLHAGYPKTVEAGGHANFNLLVKERESYIAKVNGTRNFPWRLIAIEEKDKDILSNQLVYLLASENTLPDVSWIKPGKVSWDWWNALNLSGVNFKTGFNTATYKYYIDFAARNGIEYVNLDEGWSDQFDLMKVTDKINMPELLAYAKMKKVGILLWCVWYTLDRQMIAALDQFKNWGIQGIKVDFMDRDDQVIVQFQERLLKEAAKRKMLVNYHGAYHPTGMERTYPNQINVEGVKGLEWNKFDSGGSSPQTAVTIPFIRMFAGSMDYTPGAMQNYNQNDWKQIFDRPASQGTRCHQLAMYTVYYAPLQMLADAPTAYEKEPVYLKFLSAIPTTWDQTIPLESKVGEYVTVARRKNKEWFIGGMTNWTARTINIKLDFLAEGKTYIAEIFSDGLNAERTGSDYTRKVKQFKKNDELIISMAAGGGWSAKFTLQ